MTLLENLVSQANVRCKAYWKNRRHAPSYESHAAFFLSNIIRYCIHSLCRCHSHCPVWASVDNPARAEEPYRDRRRQPAPAPLPHEHPAKLPSHLLLLHALPAGHTHILCAYSHSHSHSYVRSRNRFHARSHSHSCVRSRSHCRTHNCRQSSRRSQTVTIK